MATDNQSSLHMRQQDSGVAFGGKHWADPDFFSSNVLIDALIKHILSLMSYGMTDLGEVLDVVGHLKGSDEAVWLNEWSGLAQRLQSRAEDADAKGNRVTASTGYLRASTYWRCALFYYSDYEDARVKTYARASLKCYQRYLDISGYPGEYVEFPYGASFLPGYFYRSPVAGEKAPLLVVTPGRDTWAEDTRWVYDGAIRRGIHCLIYDGPGRGFALRLNDLTFRSDWENVVSPILDLALAKFPAIDESRIGIMGLSFGGFLSPRAAAFDKRIKICVADPGNISWGAGIIEQLKPFRDMQNLDLPEQVRNLVKDYAWKHGVPNAVKSVMDAIKEYDNSDIIDEITCETLVLDGVGEVFHGAKPFFDALKCPKDYMLFDATSTAQSHCQIGGYARATEDLFDWLTKRL
ncbi:alpha/beta hydrolase family protein [Xanthobacter sp. ZOL 2024]